MRCMAMSAMNSSLHHSIQPLQMETNRGSEDGVWLPMWQDNTKKWSLTQSSHPKQCICQCTISYIPADPKNARLENITTRAITTILTSVQLLPSFASAGSIFTHSLVAEEGLLPYPKYSYALLNVWKITCSLSASSVSLQTAMLN